MSTKEVTGILLSKEGKLDHVVKVPSYYVVGKRQNNKFIIPPTEKDDDLDFKSYKRIFDVYAPDNENKILARILLEE